MRLLPILLLAALASGCATPAATTPPAANHSTTSAATPTAMVLYNESAHDFSNGNPQTPVTKTIHVDAGHAALTLNVTWKASSPVVVAAPDPAPTAVDLLFPDKKEAGACDLSAGPAPTATCTKVSASAPEGEWTVEFEGASPGVSAKVTVIAS